MSIAPSGTVTFLFTDIQGSTKLWQDDEASMSVALERHDEIIRKAVSQNHGHVFKTVGDAFCCAFADPVDAIRGTLMAQLVLRDEHWGTPRPIRVRMSLHTGVARERDNDYFGPPVNKVARIEALAHGGQVIMSRSTAELVRENLPEGVSLREMGAHRLKDLARAEEIYQVLHPDLPGDFPPLRSMDNLPNNLPVQSTPLIGRERELSAVLELLKNDECRLVSLVGPGGMGKTRMALQLAADMLDRHRDGTWFVDLTSVTTVEGVALAVAKVLSVPQKPGADTVDLVAEALSEKQILLVLDNFEQVMSAYQAVVTWMRGSFGTKFIITSREPLNVRGEHVFRVPPLTLPKPGSGGSLSQFEATRLFIDRACAGKPDFQVDNRNAPVIAEICARLDGIPLAIELAAARIRMMNPDSILKRLDVRLKLLTGGPNDLPDRHKTLRACIDWSYDLLSETDRKVYRQISVFAGTISLRAACSVLAPMTDDELEVIEALESLVDKSLVNNTSGQSDEPSFGILETIAEYGRARLADAGEDRDCRDRHARYFHKMLSDGLEKWNGPDELDLIRSIRGNWKNIREALIHLTGMNDRNAVITMVRSMIPYWLMHNDFILCREWIRTSMELCTDRTGSDYGHLVMQMGLLCWTAGNYEEAAHHLIHAEGVFRENGDAEGSAYTRLYRIWTDFKTGAGANIITDCLEIQDYADRTGDRNMAAHIELLLGNYYLIKAGDFQNARIHTQNAKAAFEENGNRIKSAISINNLASIDWKTGDLAAAQTGYRSVLPALEDFEHVEYLRYTLCNLGQICLDEGRWDEAIGYLERVKNIAVNTSDPLYLSFSFSLIGEAYLGKNDIELAQQCALEAVEVIRNRGETVELGIAHRVLGQIAVKTGESGAALEYYESARRILENHQERDEIEKVDRCLQEFHGIGG